SLGQFRKNDLFLRNTAKLSDQPKLGKAPNRPLRRIELPRLHAISIVVLKLVMKVVITLAQGHNSHEPRVPCAAFGGIRAIAEIMAQRVDAKSAVLENNDAGHSPNEKGANGRNPATPEKSADRR